MEEKVKIVKKITEELLKNLLIEALVEVSQEEKNNLFKVQIETNDSGILIGYHGETIEALQLILSLIISNELGNWCRLVVNVGDYRQQREDKLKKLALNIAQKVKFSGQPQEISGLSSFERRIIHLALANHPDVFTESEGEGEERRLVVKPKNPKSF